MCDVAACESGTAALKSMAMVYDGMYYYLDDADVAKTQELISRTAGTRRYEPPAGALVVLAGSGGLRFFSNPDTYFTCSGCGLNTADCRCDDSEGSAEAADDQHSAQDESSSEGGRHDRSRRQGRGSCRRGDRAVGIAVGTV